MRRHPFFVAMDFLCPFAMCLVINALNAPWWAYAAVVPIFLAQSLSSWFDAKYVCGWRWRDEQREGGSVK